jgi:hypothetical protein
MTRSPLIFAAVFALFAQACFSGGATTELDTARAVDADAAATMQAASPSPLYWNAAGEQEAYPCNDGELVEYDVPAGSCALAHDGFGLGQGYVFSAFECPASAPDEFHTATFHTSAATDRVLIAWYGSEVFVGDCETLRRLGASL